MKTREQIITSMCFTYKHDFGLKKSADGGLLSSGVSEEEREHIWNLMSQIFDNDIAPHMEFKK